MRLISRLGAGLESLYLARGDYRGSIERVKLHLKEAQYLLLQGGERLWKLELKPKRPVHVLKASYSAELVTKLNTAFFSLQAFLGGEPTYKGPFAARAEIREAIHKILHADYEPERLPFFFKNKVENLLFQLLDGASGHHSESITATTWEIEAVYKVRNLILENIVPRHSIAELAKKSEDQWLPTQSIFQKGVRCWSLPVFAQCTAR